MERSTTWRLLLDRGNPGPRNMAVDDALLEALNARPWCPRHMLRLYWFEPPTLSIGAFQPLTDVDVDACAGAGVGVVRRPSGGRAVLHDGDLAYSVTGPADGPVFRGGVGDSYALIGAALQTALGELGVPGVELAAGRVRPGSGSSCFDVAAPFEPVVATGKLVGSAQLRRGGGVMQHGSLRLTQSSVTAAALLQPRRLRARQPAPGEPPCVDLLAARSVSREEAVAAMIGAFATTFGVEFEAGGLTCFEAESAAQLERYRYRGGLPGGTRRTPPLPVAGYCDA